MKKLTLSCFLLIAIAPALLVAEGIQPQNLTEGTVLPASISPDGRFCFLDVDVGATTARAVIIATTDRRTNLGRTHIYSERSMVKPQTSRVTILWAANSKLVAVHDALAKHSKAAIYRLAGEQFELLEIHDLLAAACGHWGISRDSIVSSGQRPVKWPRDDLVLVEVAARLKNGQRLKTTFSIHAPIAGRSVRQ